MNKKKMKKMLLRHIGNLVFRNETIESIMQIDGRYSDQWTDAEFDRYLVVIEELSDEFIRRSI